MGAPVYTDGKLRNIVDMLAMPDADKVEFEPVRATRLFEPAEVADTAG